MGYKTLQRHNNTKKQNMIPMKGSMHLHRFCGYIVPLYIHIYYYWRAGIHYQERLEYPNNFYRSILLIKKQLQGGKTLQILIKPSLFSDDTELS